jgi:hypothetical protein
VGKAEGRNEKDENPSAFSFQLNFFFAPILPRDDLYLATPEQEVEYRAKLAQWESATAALRKQIAEIEEPHKRSAAEGAITKFPRRRKRSFASRSRSEHRSSIRSRSSHIARSRTNLIVCSTK